MPERGDNSGRRRMPDLMSGSVSTSAVLLFLLCAVLLLANFIVWAADVIGAILYPFQLNYGEGIVWQQADMILRGEGYRPLSDASFIVFHYPPFYHVVSALLATALDLNWLMAGRIVSVLSTLGAALGIGALTFQAVRARESNLTSLICATLAGLIVFTLIPVVYWSPLARVDMISILLGLVGAWFGLRSLEHPRNVFPAALFFVLALFAKQTAISAALATFVVLLILRPATAWRGLVLGSGLGMAIFAALTVATSGQFVKHVILYNTNRLVLENIVTVAFIVASHSILFIIVYLSMTRFMRELLSRQSDSNVIVALRIFATNDRLEIARLFSVVWFCTAALTSLTIIKSGAYINYLLEWMLSWSLLVGLALRGPTRHVVEILRKGTGSARTSLMAAMMFAALGVQIAGLPMALMLQMASVSAAPLENRLSDNKQRNDLQKLVRLIRETPGPVISDDMVAVKIAGKEVIWESAIFAELTATGHWDETVFLESVRQKRFALIVTEGGPDDKTFKARYNPALILAIDKNYPRKENLADYRLHWPSP